MPKLFLRKDLRTTHATPRASRTGNKPATRTTRPARPGVLVLETRQLLHAGSGLDSHVDVLPPITQEVEPLVDLADVSGSTSGAVAAAAASAAGIPALASLPGAAASLYLDFDGHFESRWGSYSNVTIPTFDTDGIPSSFSTSELSTIQKIWEQVAEDYAPFRINVTTVAPASFANGVGLRVAIGGDSAWLGQSAGGVAYLDSFTNSVVNTAFVFPKNLGNGYAKYVAEAASHEAGHAFGLQHQSSYSATGTRLADYYGGPGDGRAPIMGNSYSATRGLWWKGTTTSATTIQDDMSVIAKAANGFGYRPDDHGSTASTATVLTAASGTQLSAAGIVTTTADVDAFRFTTGAGTVSLTLSVPAGINNLDSRLELRNLAGTTILASAAPSSSFGATLTATVPAGDYVVYVASQGNYGDVGQYTLTGVVVAAATPPPPSVNRPPVLSPIPSTTIPSTQDILTLPLAATDPDGDPITYTVRGSALAIVLDQNLGLYSTGDYEFNKGGRNEKWMNGASGYRYFLLPSGELYRWDGQPGANGTQKWTPGSGYYANPALLHDSQSSRVGATFSVSGSTATVNREDGFASSLVVIVTATDGRGGQSTQVVTITVVDPAPTTSPTAGPALVTGTADAPGTQASISDRVKASAAVWDSALGQLDTSGLNRVLRRVKALGARATG